MPENLVMSMIRVWAALAWADGHIDPAESAAMTKLIEAVGALTPAEQATVLGWLEQPVELDTGELAALDQEARHGIYRAALRLALVDQHVAAEEVRFLRRLRLGLGISESVARVLREGRMGEV